MCIRDSDLDGFRAVLAATALNVSTPLREIAAIDLCEELLTEMPRHRLSEGLLNHRITLFNDLPGGPSFKCTDLVNCTCDEEDDWERAFTQCHDLQTCTHLSYEPLLLWDENRELPQPWRAVFISFTDAASTADSAREVSGLSKDSRQCQVCGCDNLFPDSAPNGWSFTLSLIHI